jgi:hypothetical protein
VEDWLESSTLTVFCSPEAAFEGKAMSGATFLSWEEAQRLMLPPNATMLVPPPALENAEVPALAASPPPARAEWLDDAFADPAAARAAAEEVEYGPGPVRMLANVIAVNALLEYALSPPKKDEEKKRHPAEARPDVP